MFHLVLHLLMLLHFCMPVNYEEQKSFAFGLGILKILKLLRLPLSSQKFLSISWRNITILLMSSANPKPKPFQNIITMISKSILKKENPLLLELCIPFPRKNSKHYGLFWKKISIGVLFGLLNQNMEHPLYSPKRKMALSMFVWISIVRL